ncbi:phosphonate ABC transporter substrate-binding protein [Anaerobacillus alkaliphilus]|uniref:Phosphonate ABC transporter substrate-binding protein n=1 Tax=Anaerobacillus alkaliphilus TaxID=1548597 RepID=A0A4Q0VUQ1_9BACI|nr:PhnD/SsuA/transferrin family substrate-binding protein [Anaerobacillus alkaliphilus]RXJ02466.1 phosphonate ABC transporter substrate-binding protein [Anaerobacillus alkaliphilus]
MKFFGWKFLSSVVLSAALLVGCGGQETTKTQTSNTTVAGETVDERADWPKKVRFAVTGIDGMEELQRNYGAFRDIIQDLMGVEFEFFALSDRTIVTTAMEYDQVDMVLSGPSEYVLTKSAVPGAEPLAAIERDQYHTVFIVAEDSKYQTLEDLKGAKIAMKEAGSTSGHIGPSSILIDHGFNLDRDVNILLLGGASVEALKSGEVDAIGDGIRVYNKMVEEDGEGKWRLLHEGPPLPQDPFVASPKLPESFKAEFRRILFEYEEDILNAILASEDNKKYNKASIVEISDADYDLMRKTYSILGIDL